MDNNNGSYYLGFRVWGKNTAVAGKRPQSLAGAAQGRVA